MIAPREKLQEDVFTNATPLLGKRSVHEGLWILELARSLGKGKVSSLQIEKGFLASQYEVCLEKSIKVPMNGVAAESIFLLYCLQGDCYYETANKNLVKLNELQSAVVCSDPDHPFHLIIKEDKETSINIIQLDIQGLVEREFSAADKIPARIKSFTSIAKQSRPYFHPGNINLKIAELIKRLGQINYESPVPEYLRFEGICLLILASHIDQFLAESIGKVNSTSLIKREIKKIMTLGDEISRTPEKQYSLKDLCNRSGMSSSKLQEGFKFLYQRTVADYIRNVRLERAEYLLRKTDMNVSEVVYSVGLTSRSYFCKIFKLKYKCSPRDYKTKKNIQPEVLSA
ncbi:AraC-type DNA-binding protein [Robiginitalea myxolifaciens]|uniref:AraC-type DNA-binding protein n=1 Tax=Robiginitalea myxolifaciens TaxID=400055 RepID=A0A1I6FN07_9FLAO|nr:helix-turn-helix domain-containing protein [Robiginitalea myxolifaciens]SFR31345.1 AraC-type DNA-binding protein [Robiginitalea myxolifaciens]